MIVNNYRLTSDDHEALNAIRELLRKYPPSAVGITDDSFTRLLAELINVPPTQAMQKARELRDRFRAHNDKEDVITEQARQRQQELKEHPIYNIGRPGLWGLFLRSFMASVNGTPFSSANWFELNDRGLVLHTPLAAVTERTVTARDLAEKRVELGVDPPAYLDRILAVLKQLRINVQTPWGRITAREPGSGLVLADIVTIRPNEKLATIKKDLSILMRADNPYVNYKRLPKVADFLSYYLDVWEDAEMDQLNDIPDFEEPVRANRA
jgi:hypothetical protein